MFDNFLPKIVSLRDNVGICGTAGQAIDENIICGMRYELWINMGIDPQNM